MSRSNKLPFAQGATALGSTAFSTDNLTSLAHLEGQTVYLPDIDSTGDKKARRSNADVTALIVRNVEPNVDGSTTLAAGDALKWVTGYHGKRVEKADHGALHQLAGFVDEHSSGVKTNDLFYMVIKGPSLVNCKTGGAHSISFDVDGTGAANAYVEGFVVVMSDTAGKVESVSNADADGVSTGLPFNIAGRIKTNQFVAAATKLLVDVDIR